MKKILRNIIIFIFLIISLVAKADPIGYNGKVLITVESENLIVKHYHNWTSETQEERYKMISTNQNPFDNNNNYAYIELIDKKNGKTIFRKPSTALSNILISENEKYIVGISNIMVWNPYQLVIYQTNGTLIKKRNFSSEEARLTKKEYIDFSSKFKHQCEKLVEFTYQKNNYVYIDFLRSGMPTELGKAWNYLFEFIESNHLTENIWETTTNYVQWFSEKTPKIKLNYENEILISVKINDPKNKQFEISINE